MLLSRCSLIVLFVLLSSCTSSNTSTREEKILQKSEEKANKYEIYLVNPGQYTTKGEVYHRKYIQYLIGIARLVSEEYNINIVERSIGFYYDKRGDRKDKLYLGIDIIGQMDSSLYYSAYPGIALAQLRKYLNDILYIFQSCRDIFSEDEIVGSVIGIRWERNNSLEMVSIWIDQNDVVRYEKNELTFDELIQRNFITDTEGKIIKLLL